MKRLTEKQKVFKGIKAKVTPTPSNETFKGVKRNSGVKSVDGIAFPRNYTHTMTVKIPKWEIWAAKHYPDLMKKRLKLEIEIQDIETKLQLGFDIFQRLEGKNDQP